MSALVIVNKMLEAADPDDIDLQGYIKSTPTYFMDKQVETEKALDARGFNCNNQDYGLDKSMWYKDIGFGIDLTLEISIDGATRSNPVWAADVYVPHGRQTHAHADLRQSDLIGFVDEFLRERRLTSRLTIWLFLDVARQYGATDVRAE